MTDKIFPGGRGQKKPHQDTTVRVPCQLAGVTKYMANAYRWQLREGVSATQMEEWWTAFENSLYEQIDDRIQHIEDLNLKEDNS